MRDIGNRTVLRSARSLLERAGPLARPDSTQLSMHENVGGLVDCPCLNSAVHLRALCWACRQAEAGEQGVRDRACVFQALGDLAAALQSVGRGSDLQPFLPRVYEQASVISESGP